MKKKSKTIELYLNQNKGNEKKRMIFHKEVEIRFQGKAILMNENKKETDPDYQIELYNSYIVSRNGNYKIVYTDPEEKNHIICFSIRKKIPIFVFFLLFLPIFLLSFQHSQDLKHTISEKDLPVAVVLRGETQEEIIPTYQLHMYVGGENKKQKKTINLAETIEDQDAVKMKIAPGTKGRFQIQLDTYDSSDPLIYEIRIEDKTKKPKNLCFISEKGIEYSSLEELAKQELTGRMQSDTQQKFIIRWEWKYSISETEDEQDVKDANQILTYQFEMIAIGREI